MPAQHTQPLSPQATLVAQCYAVVYPEAPPRSKAMQWIGLARRAIFDERALTSDEMNDAIAELVAAAILEPSIENKNGTTMRGPKARVGTITRFCRSAHESGVYPVLLRELARSSSFRYSDYQPIPPNYIEQYAREALIKNEFDNFPSERVKPHMWFWMAEPAAKPYLARLPTEQQELAGFMCLSFLAQSLQPFTAFAKALSDINPNGMHQLVVARGYVFQGNFDKAERLVKTLHAQHPNIKQVLVEGQSLLALISLLKGEDALAMQHIQTTLEFEKRGTRKRIVYPDLIPFTLSLPALARLATTESRNLLSTLLKAREKLKLESDLDWMLLLLEVAEQPQIDFSPALPQHEPDINTLMYAIGSRWHKNVYLPTGNKKVAQILHDLWIKAKVNGYEWVAAEAQTVIEAHAENEQQHKDLIDTQFNKAEASTLHAQLGSETLTQLVAQLAPWEYSLNSLEQLALAAKPGKAVKPSSTEDASRRLVWMIKGPFGDAVNVTPVEQSLGKSGRWSGGRKVALKRLREQSDSMPFLLPQDIKAASTVQKYAYGWNNKISYETDERTVFQLVGHPCVYDSDGEQVDVVEQPAVLSISNEADQLLLRVQPSFLGPHYRTQLDTANHRLYVTHFTAAQRRIAETISTKGLRIPSTAKDRLQHVLDALSGNMSVQSDQQIATGEMQEGSSEPLLAMEPAGQSLRVRLRVEPLPDSATYFDIGTGGAVVYVQGPDGSVPVKRNLQQERDNLQAMLLRSEVLANHYDGRSFFVIEHPVDALELLEDAQANDIRCLWPKNIPFRIKAKTDLSNVSLNIKEAKEWFNASGELGVDDENNNPLTLAHLLRLMQAQPGARFIELGKGEFLSLSHTLKQQLDTLQAFSRPEKKETDTNHIHPMALMALDPLLDKATVKSDKAWKQRRQQIQEALNNTAAVPANLQAELRSYQRDGYHWLEQLGRIGAGACLADDMGLGKTIQTLALLLSRAKAGPALVVAPTSVVGNWLQESQRFAPALNVAMYGDSNESRSDLLSTAKAGDLVVISYGLIVRDIDALKNVHWHTLVLDEAQAIKNAATQRAKSVKQLNADFRVVTTGTPVQNNLMDLHSLFGFLNPTLLGSEANFRQRFAIPISKHNNEHARNQLQQLIAPFLLRRHKRDVLKELPERTEVTLKVQLSKEEASLYDIIRREALESLKSTEAEDSKTGSKPTVNKPGKKTRANNTRTSDETDLQATARQKMIILSYLTKLRRLCCHPSLIAPDWKGPESKLEEFSSTLHELISSGHRALVFSQFVDHLKIIANHLDKQDISYQYLDGSTTAKQRTARVSAFQGGEGQVFLISLNAGGSGLNLTAADYVIHMDPWWNPAVEDQASDRAHRIGQQRPVTVVRMVTTGTIEEQIQELHGTKRELADSVLAGADSPSLNMDAMLSLLHSHTDY